jgi:arylsulfatase A-like enzyme
MNTSGYSLLGSQRRTGLLLEADRDRHGKPAYCGWRSDDWLYVHYATGEEELYSVPGDPLELHNLAADPAYSTDLTSLRAGVKQACSPMPPHFHW